MRQATFEVLCARSSLVRNRITSTIILPTNNNILTMAVVDPPKWSTKTPKMIKFGEALCPNFEFKP